MHCIGMSHFITCNNFHVSAINREKRYIDNSHGAVESRERHGIERAIFSSRIESDLWPILQKTSQSDHMSNAFAI